MSAVLNIDNLHVSYGAIRALRGVSIHIEEGEIVTLIGGNGAGKTTLVKSISRLIPKKEGTLEFRGEDLSRFDPHQIVEAGIVQVPEGRSIFHNLSVLDNLRLGAYTTCRKDTFTKNLKDVFLLFPRLEERVHQPGGTLSGGEQQMLAIGRALMSEPKLLLLDEPSLGLAPNLVCQIFQSLKTIHQQKGISILLVEQDAFLALKTASRGYVMENGEIRLGGLSGDLLKNPEVKKAYLGV